MTTAFQQSFNFRQARGADELMEYVSSPDFDARELPEEDEAVIYNCVSRYNRRIKRLQEKHHAIRSVETHDGLQRAYSERGHLNLELARRENERNSQLPPAQLGDSFEKYGHVYVIKEINILGTINCETADGRNYLQFTGGGRRVKGDWQAYRGGAAEEFEEITGRKWGAGKIVVPRSRSTSVSTAHAYLVAD